MAETTGVLSNEQASSGRAARYDAWFSTPLGAAMDAAEAAAVLALAAPRAGERALDAGRGTGIYTRHLLAAGATVTGVDCDPEVLTAASVKAPCRRRRHRVVRARRCLAAGPSGGPQ